MTELLETVSLDGSYASRRPHQLSGGQQQRVALARALARKPVLMLLDEPFSALDTGLRASTRKAVARLLADAGVTTLLVTHDQEEALSIADQVAVMRDGRFTQVGAPQDVYRQPNDRFTAEFLGDCISLPCTVASGIAECALGHVPVQSSFDDGPATLALRPEQLVATLVSDSTAHARSTEDEGRDGVGTVIATEFLGARRAAHDRPGRRYRTDHRATAQPQSTAHRREGSHRKGHRYGSRPQLSRLVDHLRCHGERIAVLTETTSLTYRELADRVTTAAAELGDTRRLVALETTQRPVQRRSTTSARWPATTRRCPCPQGVDTRPSRVRMTPMSSSTAPASTNAEREARTGCTPTSPFSCRPRAAPAHRSWSGCPAAISSRTRPRSPITSISAKPTGLQPLSRCPTATASR